MSAMTSISPAQSQLASAFLVRAENVVRTYNVDGQAVHALRGVNLDLPGGVLAVLRGRSGSGKTTLLNMIGGLDHPTSGKIWFENQPLDGLSDQALTEIRREKMGFVFQSFALMPTYSAIENVELALRLTEPDRKRRLERARRSLKVVGLAKWMDHRPDEMSGGQQQRLAIARSLANRPTLILADEPTGELDTATTRQILALFRHLVDQEGVTILTTTHDPIVLEYADIIYTLQDGVIETQQ
jgi:ABC-type lipoprotein export system ATPase subunit